MRIAIGGSAANPPHWGHLQLLIVLLECGLFDRIIWIISGSRADKDLVLSEFTLPEIAEYIVRNHLYQGESS